MEGHHPEKGEEAARDDLPRIRELMRPRSATQARGRVPYLRFHDTGRGSGSRNAHSLSGQAANVLEATDNISVKDLRNRAGLGFYDDTIIGPVRLDFGAGGQHRYMAYFPAGFDF